MPCLTVIPRLALIMSLLLIVTFQVAIPGEAAAQEKVTLTLSADILTLRENAGPKTVTVTATLDKPFSETNALEFPLILAKGTAKINDDFTLAAGGSKINIPAGQKEGSIGVVITPTDDNFWELEEEILIEATPSSAQAARIEATPVRIKLVDEDTKPNVNLAVVPNRIYEDDAKGKPSKVKMELRLDGDVVLDVPLSVTVSAAAFAVNKDAAWSEAPPWTFTIPPRKLLAKKTVTLTIPDDKTPEKSEVVDLTGTAAALGTTFSVTSSYLVLDASDQINFAHNFTGNLEVTMGTTGKFTVQATAWGGTVGEGGWTYTLQPPPDVRNAFTPQSLTFTWAEGTKCIGPTDCQQTKTWDVEPPVTPKKKTFGLNAAYSGTGLNEGTVRTHLWQYDKASFIPPPEPAEVVQSLSIEAASQSTKSAYVVGQKFLIKVVFNRPVELAPGTSLRMYLDSGPIDIPCAVPTTNAQSTVSCTYTIVRSDYDFDQKLQVEAGGLDFGPYLNDPRDSDTNYPSPTVPAEATTLDVKKPIFGSNHAFKTTATVLGGFREGARTRSGDNTGQTVEVVMSDIGQTKAAKELKIPITVTNGTTTDTDWKLRQAGWVTIPKGATEGNGTIKLEALLDGLKEDDEILWIGGGGNWVVKPAPLTLRDAARVKLTASVSEVPENASPATQDVTLTWKLEDGALALTQDVKVGARLKGTATVGKDYEFGGATGRLTTLKSGDLSVTKTIPLKVIDDLLVEGDETIRLVGVSPFLVVGETTITIKDNDTTPAVILSVQPKTFAEGGGKVDVDVTAKLGGATLSEAVHVDLDELLAGEAIAGPSTDTERDYTAAWSQNRRITIPAEQLNGSRMVTLSLTPFDDQIAEGEETIHVQGTATQQDDSKTKLSVGIAKVTLTDNDTPGVEVTPTTLSIEAGAEATYSVRLKSQPSLSSNENVHVAANLPARSPVTTVPSGLDFDATTWGVAQTMTVRADPRASPQSVTITNSVSGGDYRTITADPVAVTVLAAPTLKLKLDKESVSEGGEVAGRTATVTAELSKASARDITVSVEAAPVDPAVAGDFTLSSNATLTIAAGATTSTGTVTITANDNDFYLPAGKEITVSGTVSGHGGVPKPANLTLAIDDDDGRPSFSIADVSADEDKNLVFTVTRSGAADNAVSVQWKTELDGSDGASAASAADFTEVSALQTLAFAATETEKTITVTVSNDELDEPDGETFFVALSNPTGAEIPDGGGRATGTINDNDDPVSFSIADAEATEGGKITFTVSRDGAKDNVASVKVATATDSGDDVNAADADDYTAIATAQTLNFAKGVTSQTVEVQTTQDDLFEPDETFKAVLSAPALAENDPGTGVSIEAGKGTATGTIKNDDVEPSFAVADASASEGDAITFTVTREGAMDNAVSVKWNTKADSSDGANAASTDDYTPVTTATTLTFAKDVGTQTFTVATTEDTLHEGNETFLVELTGAVGGTIATAEATGTINDDDAVPDGITLSVDTNGATEGTPSTVAEDAGATVVTVTATVNGETRYVDEKTVEVSVADNTASSPGDYAAVSNFTITIAAGAASQTGSFTVTPVDDDLDEVDETMDVTGTLTDVTITGATVTLTDTDAPVSFSIADAEADEGGKVTFTVTRAGAEDNVASVKIATAADSGDDVNAAGTDDYTAIVTAQTLNFAAGVTSQTVEVQTTEDDLFEPDETFKAVLSAPALAENDPGTGVSLEAGKGTATGTIKNDDTEPSFAVADADAAEGDAITFTVTREGAMDNAVSVKWNTKADSSDGANAASATDYTPVPTARTLTFAKGVDTQTFTVATTEDTLHEGDETFLVELTGAVGGTITTAEATGTITDDDDAPTGITLSVDTNGATAGTPSTVAEDAGATVVTVTATVNGETRYVEPKTVTVSVADNTAASPADYAAVSNFNITIAAGAASQTGSFTVTPVDDDLDEADETMDVTGTLTDVTITGATVTLTDTDDPVSFSIADAEVAEGGKVTFTVSRKGAENNVASVKIATAADSGTDVNAADADDYTAIAPAQTLNFAKGVTSQTVEVQTTDDDLFEPDETFKAVLSAPALAENDPGTGVSLEAGKGTATGTIKNDDTEPSFEVADASASEGDAITFTVTRSGAKDNAVSVKWNTKADSSDGANAASATDYTPAPTATTLTFAKGIGSQTFTVATTEDVLHEENETFLVELTSPEGGTIATAEATGTITNDDAAPTGITLSVDTNGATEGTPSTVAEDAGATVVTVTATVNGDTRYVDAKTVVVSVADNTAVSPADYAAVNNFNITIAAGAASQTGSFTVTPVDDDLDEPNEIMDVTGTLTDVTITGATVTLTDTDAPVSFSIADAEATEGGKVVFKVSRAGAEDNVASVKIATAADSGEDVNAADADDYTAIATARTVNFAKGVTSQTVEVQTTQDDLFEPDETFKAVLSAPALAENDPGTGVSIETGKGTATGTIKNDDTEPSFEVADASASEGDAITFTVTRSGAKDNAVSVKWNTKADSSDGANAASATDYTPVPTATTLTFAKGVGSQTFTVATTEDVLHEENETFLVELTGAVGGTIATAEATGTITNDDTAPSGITLSVDTNGATEGTPSTVAEDAGATVVTVTATVNGETRYVDAKTVAVSVADNTASSPGDYAAVSTFNITIAAGAASQTGSFTVTPVDDNLDEVDETMDVTGTLTDVTITGATVTLTDTDAPVSFSIADAEATEGGKVTFTVSRAGAGDNVASVKIATAADSGTDVNAADADDYTAIVTAQTLNFAKGVDTQTVEVQTTQDDLFEPDETFKAVLSAPALAENDPGTGVSLEAGKGTATGTIKNDDTEPSFAVADASASEGAAITFTVTRSGAADNAVSVKWNTKAATGAGAASASDYTTATTTKLDFAKGVRTQTFTVATTQDTLHEGNETFLVELTGAVGGTIATAEATGTITDDDAAPTGITLSVSHTAVNENAGATVVTVTATVNGTTRYVDAKTVEVSVADNTAVSPADYAAVSNFNITIAAGAASQTGSFTVTPVDDDLDEVDETMDVTGTLTDVTITGATVTLTDTDAPVSFSIADAEATEGGKITFTVSRKGAEDNVASVKVATATDSGADVNAADADDYTALATAQTLNFAKGITSQTVEVQTTQDDLFEPDETFKAVLSAPALAENDPGTGVSIETGKGTATGTIKNDDTEPSFAVADANASEGDAITFTVTREGAADNAVSVKWNTKADSSDGANAASATDYTPAPTATTLTFAKGVGTQTFTVATTEDALHEGNETFLVELTGAVGGTITTAEATGTITDDDVAPSGITLTVSPDTVEEDAGKTKITVTATVNGSTRYVDAKTVTVSVGGGTAISGTDYAAVSNFNITIAAGTASHTGTFDLTPTDDNLDEANETIDVTGTSGSLDVTKATVTINDNDDAPSGITLTVSPAAVEEDAGKTKITVTATVNGTTRYVDAKTVKVSVGGGTAISGTDYAAVSNFDITIAAGTASHTGTFDLTPTNDDLDEANETIDVTGTSGSLDVTKATVTINDNDETPTVTLNLGSASINESGDGNSTTVTATLSGKSDKAVTLTVAAAAGADTVAGDFTLSSTTTLTIAAGTTTSTGTVTITAVDNDVDAPNKSVTVSATASGGGVANPTNQTLTINNDDDRGISVSLVTLTLAEADDPSTQSATEHQKTYSIELDSQPTGTVTVTLASGDTKIATLSDTSLQFTTSDWDVQTVTVTAVPDAIDNAGDKRTVRITHTVSAAGTDYKDETAAPVDVTVTDDDGEPTLSIDSPSVAEGDSSTATMTFKVTLTPASGKPVTVAYADATTGTATSATDYAAITSGTLNFAAGQTEKTVDVTVNGDTTDEPNETVILRLSSPSNVALSGGKATLDGTGTINDDDATPTATLVLTPATIDESGNKNESTVTATLSGASSEAVTLTVAAAAVSPAVVGDFTLSTNKTLTIAAGSKASTGAVTITAVDNSVDAPNKSVTVSATASGGGVADPDDATLTITDDDTRGVTVAGDPLTMDEADKAGTAGTREDQDSYTVVLDSEPTDDVRINLTAPAMVTLSATSLTFTTSNWNQAQTVTATAVNDSIDNAGDARAGNITHAVVAGASDYTGVVAADVTVTVNDDDGEPALSIDAPSVAEGDSATATLTFKVTLSPASGKPVSVAYADAATGTATSATDYAAITSGTLNFAVGQTEKTVDVTVNGDTTDEPSETVILRLSSPSNARLSGGAQTLDGTGTITDDDDAPTVSVANATAVNEGNAPDTTVDMSFTVTLSEASSLAVTVPYTLTGTATGGSDYETPASTSLSIAAGDTSGTIVIKVKGDILDEPNETIIVTLGAPTNATVSTVEGAGTGTGTITDDDDTPAVTLKLSSTSVDEDGGATSGRSTVTATLSGASSQAVTLTVAASAVDPATNSDFTLAGTTLTIAAGSTTSTGTVTITAVDNTVDAPDKTVTVSATASGGGVADPANQTLTILDDDEAGKELNITVSLGEGNTSTKVAENVQTAPTITVTASLAGEVTSSTARTVNVTVGHGDDTATKVNDYKAVDDFDITIAAEASSGTGSFTFTPVDDAIDENDETVSINGAFAGSDPVKLASITITDNDTRGVTVAGGSLSMDEADKAGTQDTREDQDSYTVVLDSKPTDDVSINLTAPAMVTLSPTSLTFTPSNWNQAQTVTATAVNDSIDNAGDARTGNITHAVVAGDSDYAGVAAASVAVTVNDDDDTPTVTLKLSSASITENGGSSTVTASLSGASSQAITLTVTAAAVSPAVVGDFTLSGTTLTIAAGATESTGTVTITAVDNDVDAANKTVTVSATATGGNGVANPSAATLTITDDDERGISVSPVALTLAEVDNPSTQSLTEHQKTYTVELDSQPTGTVTVTLASGDTKIATLSDTSLQFTTSDWDAQTVTVTAVPDAIDNAGDARTVRITHTVSAAGTDYKDETAAAVDVTVTDDDDTPTVTLELDPTTIYEKSGDGQTNTSTVTATLSGKSHAAVTLTVAAAAGANTAAGDFTLTGTTLTIAAGATTSTGTVTITAVDNTVDAPNKTVTVSATASGGGVATPANQTLTITDDDAAPTGITLAVSPATVGEAAGETEITVTATVTGGTHYVDAKTVRVSVGGGTAISGTDYAAVTSFDVIIAAGTASKAGTFDLTPTDDALHEGSETIDVTGTSGSLSVTKAAITLTDDDAQPSFAVADASATEGDAITFTVTRSGAQDNAVSVKWNTKADSSDGANAASASDYTTATTATKLDFAKDVRSQQFTVATTEDALHEGNETFLVELTEPVGGTISDAEATGTINDDDAAPTALTLTVDADTGTANVQTSLAEDGGAKTVRVTATLGGSSTFTEAKTVTVEVGKDADSATEGTDYANVGTQSITINAGKSSGYVDFPLTPTNDDIDEPNEEGISIEGTLTGVTVTGTAITITDDEVTPTATLVLTPTAIDESGDDNASTVTATLTGKSNVDVTLTVAATAGAATAAGDFTLTGTTLTIAAGATTSTGTVTITAVDNDVDAPNKTVTVSATASGGSVTNPDNQTLTITDDEGVPTATLVLTPTAIDESGDDNASTVTATLTGKSNVDVTLTVAATAGAATAAGDFTLTGTTLTIAAGATTSTGTVTITAVDNDVDAPNKTVTVSATASGGSVTNPDNQTLTITDDEGVPTATLVLTPTAIDESGDDNASTVTATLTGKSNVDVTLTVAATAGAATAAGDFTLTGTTLTIAAGATTSTGTVTITAVDNDVDAPNKTVTVSATASGGSVTNPDNQTLTITDDEGVPTATLVLTPTAIDESGDDNASTVTATLTGKSNVDVTLTVAATAGAATAAGDFTLTGTTLTIAAGATTSTGTVTITAVDNDVDAPNKTVTVSATASGGSVTNPDNQTLTITDDEGVPTATLVLTPTAIDESGDDNASTVTATLTGKSNVDVTLTVAATAGAATAAGDFTLTGTTLTIAAGATTSTGTVTITAVDNDVDAPNKTVTVSATASGGSVTNPDNQTLTITDDEGVPTATLVLTPTAIDESGDDNASTVTATLTGKSNVDVTLTVAATAGAATAAGDFTLTGTTLTIAAGATTSTGTVTITAVDNDVDAPNKTVTVSATASGGSVTNPDNQTLTITDDEGVPTATLVLTPTAIDESGDDNASTVTATLTGKSNVDVTLTVAATAGAATAAGDFTLTGTTLTIAAGATTSTGTVTITAVDNDVDAPNKTVTVSATASGGSVTNPDNQTLTITDDEGVPTATLVLTPTAIDESGDDNASTVTATLTGKSNVDVTLTVAATAGAATAAGDFTLTGTTLTIAAGATTSTGTVTITAVDNDVDAPNKTVTVSATASGGSVTNPDNQTLTITDDEGVPTATLVLTPTAIDESGDDNASTVTATLTGKSNVDVTLTVAATAGAATAAGDFTLTGTTLTIAAGATTSTGTVTITAVDNDVDAPNKTVTVSATASGGSVTNPGNQTLTIEDDEGEPTLSIDSPSVAEGDNGTATLTFKVTLSPASGNPVSVAYADATTGTATSATDYAAITSGTLNFAAGQTEKTVDVTVNGDTADEPNETVVLRLSSPSNAALSGGSTTLDGTGTITDDDDAPTVSVADATAVTEGDAPDTTVNMSFTVTLSAASANAVTVPYTLTGTATGGSDYETPSSTSLSIAAGDTSGTIVIKVKGDTLDEPNETIIVTLGTPTNTTVSTTAGAGTGTGTITDDDDTATVELVLTPTRINESGNGNASTVTARLSGPSSAAVTVEVSVPNDAPVTVSANTTLTIAAGATTSTGTVTLTAVDNDADAANATVVVSGTATGGGGDVTNPADVTLTITDDDTAAVTLVLTPATINESGDGNASTVTATLSGPSSAVVTVEVSVPNDAPVTVSSNTTLTIAAGATTSTGTVTLTAVDNDADAANTTVVVSGTATGGGGDVANPADVTLTITDDDAATVTLVLTPTRINESGDGNVSTVTATLSGPSNAAVTVEVSVPNDAPVTVSANTTLTIAVGETTSTGTVTLTAVDNAVDGPDATVVVSGTATAPEGDVASPAAVTLTITDDEATPSRASLSVTPASAGEADGATSVTVTATVDGAARTTSTVLTISVTPGTAQAADFEPVEDFPLTIAAEATTGTATFTLTPVDDTLEEPDETLQVTGTSGALSLTPATVVLEDNDDRSIMAITGGTADEGTAVVFTVTRTGGTENAATVQWATEADTAGTFPATTADYTPVSSARALDFAPGETRKQVAVSTTDDALDEFDETFVVRLSGGSGSVVIAADGAAATGTILDNDAPPELLIGDVTVEEGAVASFPVTLSAVSGKPIRVTWRTVEGTATEEQDYTGQYGQFTIPAGERTVDLIVPTIDDRAVEDPEETYTLRLFEPEAVVLGGAASRAETDSGLVAATTADEMTALGTILDDDRARLRAQFKQVNEALLPWVGSALLRRHLDRITGCLQETGTAGPDMGGMVERAVRYAETQRTAQQTGGRQPSLWETLGDTRLAGSLGPADPDSTQRPVTLCAGTHWRRLTNDGPVSWEGALLGANLNGHMQLGESWRVGLDVAHDQGRLDWQLPSVGEAGEWELTLTGVRPYVAWQTPAGVQAWGLVGYSGGTLEVTASDGVQADGIRQRTPVTHRHAAVGGAVPLMTVLGGGFRLRGDAWLGTMEVEDNGDLLVGLTAQNLGVRGLVDGTWEYALGASQRLTPAVRLGVQYDDGAGGTGVEVGTDVGWEDLVWGLQGRVTARTLLVDGVVREWGLGGQVRLVAPDGLGPLLDLSTARGNLTDGRAQWWEQGLGGTPLGPATPGMGVDLEAGWGLRVPEMVGILTPYVGVGLVGETSRTLRLGGRLTVASGLAVAVEALRRDRVGSPPEQGLFLQLRRAW